MEKITAIRIPRILIAAPASGNGKTLMTCALLRLLGRRGIRAAAFKCGPDFIDPMFHKRVLGTPSRNLDLYLAGEEGVRRALLAGCREAGIAAAESRPDPAGAGTPGGIAVIEGVMGYWDGTGESGMEGSSYQIAQVTRTPVILAADVRGMSRSAAALIRGFAEYGEEKLIRGVLLNRASAATADRIAGWVRGETGISVIGSLPADERLHMESRHLGLVEPGEIPGLLSLIDRAADLLEETLDLEALLAIAESAPLLEVPKETRPAEGLAPDRGEETRPAVTIAVAEDEAFSFYYEDNLDLLRELGARIVPFSPLRDRALPEADGLLIGGGYPELRAAELAANTSMLGAIRRAAANGMPILAECGGFQYLQEELEDAEGRRFPMAGVLPGRSTMTRKLVRFGYVEVQGKEQYFAPGRSLRGHEFHYSDSTCSGSDCRAVRPGGRSWNCMVLRGRIAAGYPHLYYRSDPAFAAGFVEACGEYHREQADKRE